MPVPAIAVAVPVHTRFDVGDEVFFGMFRAVVVIGPEVVIPVHWADGCPLVAALNYVNCPQNSSELLL